MPGKMISRANLAHVQEIYERAKRLGAREPEAGAKAYTLRDMTRAVEEAIYRAAPMYGDILVYEDYAILMHGIENYRISYTMDGAGVVTVPPQDQWQRVEAEWVPVAGAAPLKAGELAVDDAAPVLASVKALGDRTIELRVAWGKDGHGEAFSPATDFDLDNFPAPPVLYYHGYKADGKPAPKPVVIGRTLSRENRADGHYLTARLNTKAEADKVLQAAAEGRGFVSPGTAAHLIRKDQGGALLYWPIVEISAWDGAPTRKQAHPHSLAFLKAAYLEAGLTPPPVLNETPEAAGDAAGAVAIDPETIKQVLAAEVARALTEGTN